VTKTHKAINPTTIEIINTVEDPLSAACFDVVVVVSCGNSLIVAVVSTVVCFDVGNGPAVDVVVVVFSVVGIPVDPIVIFVVD
jgi:hypothetical protein